MWPMARHAMPTLWFAPKTKNWRNFQRFYLTLRRNSISLNMNKKIVVAIDGYSSSGKSTMARQLAVELGYRYIDSGAMYRAVTLFAIRNGLISADNSVDTKSLLGLLPEISISFSAPGEDGRSHTLLNGEDVEGLIRGLDVAAHVSTIAAIPEVRHHLVKLQQQMGLEKGIVMDGRDIGTTVFPDAELKIFVDASPEVRAMRRFKELQQSGRHAEYEEVLANIRHRDSIDTTRAESPLRKADDALLLNNDTLTPRQQLDWIMEKVNALY